MIILVLPLVFFHHPFGIITAQMSSLGVPQTGRAKLYCFLDAQLFIEIQLVLHREHSRCSTAS